MTPEAAGQLNRYLNYYAAEINDPDKEQLIAQVEAVLKNWHEENEDWRSVVWTIWNGSVPSI